MPRFSKFRHHLQCGLLPRGRQRMEADVKPRSLLDDPDTAAHAWARYRRIMRGMLLLVVTMVAGACIAIFRQKGIVSAQFYVLMALGIGFAMLLMSALMGLVFLPRGDGQNIAVTALPDNEDED